MSGAAGCRVGFDGKLPSRGDFVSFGLPQSFLKPWRTWVDRAVNASQQTLGADWLPAWLEAPVWHFAAAPGVIGPDAILGLMFPSVDRAGRHYPMTIAAVVSGFACRPAGDGVDHWLIEAQSAGLDALMNDSDPAVLAAALAELSNPHPEPADSLATKWWTAGSPMVSPATLWLPALPRPTEFAALMAGPRQTTSDHIAQMNL